MPGGPAGLGLAAAVAADEVSDSDDPKRHHATTDTAHHAAYDRTQFTESEAAMENDEDDEGNPIRTWATVVAMSVLAATAVMAQQPAELPEQVAFCAAMRMVPAADWALP